uniref:N-acetylglucosamine-1-phosphodiester alpha-N-acetylglucosaminidase n=1 Tax=Sphenodon punctatus TaxID=8508 RepID=A0A8D0GKR3_SPHPU
MNWFLFRNSLEDDLLLPYPPLQHGPRHNHRYVRDCQAVEHVNVTHESWPSDNSTDLPLTTIRTFVSYIPREDSNQGPVYGHFTFVKNPLRLFSVLEPGSRGGCNSSYRATVEETARHGKCLVAQNGGFFDTVTGECLGNIVSNGRLVRNAGGVQNAQFGIRKDGTMVFGYLSEEDVLDTVNPFVQLVSGVVWLLRNKTVYIGESKVAECDKTQTTGDFDKFINTISARTAVGHNEQGQLVLFHADGQTDGRGLNLWDLAHFLKDHGVVNAINLDGGGSATLVLNGTLASYPSDHCEDNMWRCPRSISTVLCIHEPVCQPPDCSGHGRCILGKCQCTGDFWRGPDCSNLDCGPFNCSLHGICTESGCLCDAGWMGSNCSEECSIGWYGPNCQQICECENMCPCDQETGSCNITYESAVQDKLSRVGQCLASHLLQARSEENFRFAEWVWICIAAILMVLLVISVLGNLRLLSCKCGRKHENGEYTYYLLNELNGETNHTCTSAE